MTITELVEKNHAAMVKKGFHQEEKNIGEVLMLIVSELGEALDAHRKKRKRHCNGIKRSHLVWCC